jgi:hypothetical protein
VSGVELCDAWEPAGHHCDECHPIDHCTAPECKAATREEKEARYQEWKRRAYCGAEIETREFGTLMCRLDPGHEGRHCTMDYVSWPK